MVMPRNMNSMYQPIECDEFSTEDNEQLDTLIQAMSKARARDGFELLSEDEKFEIEKRILDDILDDSLHDIVSEVMDEMDRTEYLFEFDLN